MLPTQQPNVSIGTAEMPATLDIQRGLWKHQFQKRAPISTMDKIDFSDPLDPSKGRRQQVSIWYVTINTNKRQAGLGPKGRRSQKKRAKAMNVELPKRGGKIPENVIASLSMDSIDASEILKSVVHELHHNKQLHAQVFAFGSNIDESKAKSRMATTKDVYMGENRVTGEQWISRGSYKKLRQPTAVGKVFARDRRLVINPLHYNKVIKRFDISPWEPELGPVRGGVHCHFYLEVIHFSQLQIDLQRFPQLLRVLWNKHCDHQGKAYLKYDDELGRSGKLKAPSVYIVLQSESSRSVAEDGVDIVAGNKYGTAGASKDRRL